MKNKYPRGKLNDSDEGALAISVYEQDKSIIIDFGKDVSWIGMDKITALNLAQTIMKHADKIGD
jgi:hypothetical protein